MSFSKRGEFSLTGQRLHKLSSYYLHHDEIWDIGCDHGNLGLSFLDVETVKGIYLVDPSSMVIQELNNKINASHIPKSSKIHLLQKKGQEIKLTVASKCIFIAGMGGKEIEDILIHLIPQLSSSDRLVISPHRKVLELREMLTTGPLGLVSECSVEEWNQFYPILVLEKREDLPKPHRYGRDLWQGETGKRYLEKELKSFQVHQDPTSKGYVAYLRAFLAASDA